jgi:hypothetical protein
MADLRIGDAERDRALSALGEHFAAGRLTREEYDERADAIWSARTQRDLEPMFADLPRPVVTPPARRRPFPVVPVVPIVVGLVVLTAVTHVPFVLLAVLGCFLLARRRGFARSGWAPYASGNRRPSRGSVA